VNEPTFTVSDSKWREIATVSGLPDEARTSVELVAGYYERFIQVTPRAETLKQLQEIKHGVESIETYFRDRPTGLFNAYVSANAGDGMAMLRTDSAFEEYEKMLDALRGWTDRAIADLPPENRAPRADPHNLDWLVNELDKILESFASNRISRSEKSQTAEFVKLVVESIPGHKPTGVKEAVKRHAAKTS
jgi:hypothetical protein